MDRDPASAKGFARCPECEYRLPTHAYDCSVGKQIGRRNFLKKLATVGAIGAVSGFAAGIPVGHAITSGNNTVVEPGSLANAFDYIMFNDGSNWFARNGVTGGNDVKNSDFVTALIAAQALGGLRFFVKPPSPWATIPLSASIPLKSGMTLQGLFPNAQMGTGPGIFEAMTFNSGTVFAFDGTHSVDPLSGNAVQNCLLSDFGVSGFTTNNGIKSGASNTLGMMQSIIQRIVFTSVALPINIQNFQYVTMRNIYAWLPTTNFILAQNNNTTLFGGSPMNGGNSYWEDLFAHGCKNVNGAVSLIATNGSLNLIECHRLQVNMIDSSGVGSTSGYGLYLSGASATALCQTCQFYGLDIEGTPLKAVRLEDWAINNSIRLALGILSAGGFHFSLKKNATTQAPISNLLEFHGNTGGVNLKVESDNDNNFLISSLPLVPITGSFPAGINGVGMALFNGVAFATMYGGGSGQAFVGHATSNIPAGSQSANLSIVTDQIPQVQQAEAGCMINITAYTSGTLQVQCTFQDQNGTNQTVTIPLCKSDGTIVSGAAATGLYYGAINFATNANQTITVKTVGVYVASFTCSGFVRAIG